MRTVQIASKWAAVVMGLAVLPVTGNVVRASAFELPLSVEDAAGVERKAEPACGGVPLPAATFKKDQAFAVFAGGTEIPAQVLPLVVDEQGFMRWVLIDIQTDLGGKEKKIFTLKAVAPAAKPATPLKIDENAAGVTVDTGKIKFTIAKDKPLGLFASLEAGGKPVVTGSVSAYVDTTATAEGQRFLAEKPASVIVEYAGPLRATICVRGRFAGDDQTKMQYIVRVTAWAGRSDMQVKYSLANSNPDNYVWRRIQESALRLKLADGVTGTLVGAGSPLEASSEAWIQQSMRVVRAAVHGDDSLGRNPCYHQIPGATGPGGAKAASGDKDLWTSSGKDDVSAGWIAAKLNGSVVLAADLYFVEDPPRRLAVEKGELALYGVTEPLDKSKAPFGDKQRWIHDCSHLSSQYYLDFQAPTEVGELSRRVRAARAQLHLMAPPSWYFATEALPVGAFGTQEDELACYDKWGWQYDKAKAPKSPAMGIPRWVCGDDNHFTSEQDTLDALLLMYLRTGSRSFFDGAQAWANYFMNLEAWRTDGWRWKDGGVWWSGHGSPIGNMPQRAADPVTGMRNRLVPLGEGKAGPHEVKKDRFQLKVDLSNGALQDLHFLADAKQCYCHNWGEGLAEWFLITGDRDALEAALDCVEQNYDTQKRAFGKAPGKASSFSRDFTRSCELANSVRLCLPSDPFVIETSDYLARTYLDRPVKEPRGFLVVPGKINLKTIETKTGPKGLARMKELGVTVDDEGRLNDPKTGAKWFPVADPHTWMFPPLSRAMETYYRITGNEDALDWLIAYGEAVALVLYQPKHGNLCYSDFLVDFPVKGFAWDRHSWDLPEGSTDGTGVGINGYQARFHPDICARAYAFTGEPMLKQRAFDFWNAGSHRGYYTTRQDNVGKVGRWANCYSTHDESVCFIGKMFYVWAHERKDDKPPKAVEDLKVTLDGDGSAAGKATVSFTAPGDEGGGRVARYQLKCADKPLVSYERFLDLWKENKDSDAINWWMAANLKGEPAPHEAGARETFTVTGVPAGAKYFALVSFDDSANRSTLGNVAEAGK